MYRLDKGQIEVVDDAVAAIIKTKSGPERLSMVWDAWSFFEKRKLKRTSWGQVYIVALCRTLGSFSECITAGWIKGLFLCTRHRIDSVRCEKAAFRLRIADPSTPAQDGERQSNHFGLRNEMRQ